ncbi:hypothetical protein Q7P37_006137 [Cladosporium fusiforme]
METFLRRWRDDAVARHQYESATYVGDKLVALTGSDDDRLALAQTHFAAANYTRAFALVSRADLLQRSAACKYLAAHCYIKQDRHEDALGILGDKNPTHLLSTTDGARRKLQGLGNGVSSKQHGKTKMPTRIERADRSEEREAGEATDFKHEAGMCHLRGLCFAKQNAFDRAKECYKDAVRIDVQCFEAFDQLMKNSLMSPSEEWVFLDSLNFETLQPDPMDPDSAPEAADFVRNLYITRLSKYHRPEDFTSAIDTLSTHYRLNQNADVLLAKAEILSTSARYPPALALTSAILSQDPYNFPAIPLHLSLLYQLNHAHALFSLSHDLADSHPHEPTTWLAVGTYYLATNRIPEARSYFSKASLMDPPLRPRLDRTAARLFQGTHLPQMFLGMQETALGNLTIAREYLTAAYDLCDRDPSLLNEIGVVAYLEDDADAACRHFELALTISLENETPPSQTTTTRLNLAHAHRRAGRLEESLDSYNEAIRLGHRTADIFAAKGLVLLEMEQAFDATVAFHEALALSPQDPIAGELLQRALGLLEGRGRVGG